MDSKPKTIKIDEVEYVRADAVAKPVPNGTRVVLVVDQGWIFAGDVVPTAGTPSCGRIRLSRAVNVVNWSNVGFDGMLKDPKSKSIVIKSLEHDVDVPAGAELFRIPVSDNWGL